MKNQFQLQKLKENDFYEPQKQFPIAGVRICIKCIFWLDKVTVSTHRNNFYTQNWLPQLTSTSGNKIWF